MTTNEFVDDYIKTKELSHKDKLKDIDLMIEAFIEEERYEDCAFLVKIKNRIEEYYHSKQVDGLINTLNNKL